MRSARHVLWPLPSRWHEAGATTHSKENLNMNLNAKKENELDRDTITVLSLADVEQLRAALGATGKKGAESMSLSPNDTIMCPKHPWDQ
jgi:hypothetical protein